MNQPTEQESQSRERFPSVPTIDDGTGLIRKIEACESISAKLVLLRCAQIVKDYIDNSLMCECGAGDPAWQKKKIGKMYNTECGHAIECPIYLGLELLDAIRQGKGTR